MLMNCSASSLFSPPCLVARVLRDSWTSVGICLALLVCGCVGVWVWVCVWVCGCGCVGVCVGVGVCGGGGLHARSEKLKAETEVSLVPSRGSHPLPPSEIRTLASLHGLVQAVQSCNDGHQTHPAMKMYAFLCCIHSHTTLPSSSILCCTYTFWSWSREKAVNSCSFPSVTSGSHS